MKFDLTKHIELELLGICIKDAGIFIETRDYIGNGHWIIEIKALSIPQQDTIRIWGEELTQREVDNENAKKVIPQELGDKYEPESIMQYVHSWVYRRCVWDGKAGFNIKYYWLLTNYLNLEIYYAKGSLNENAFALVKDGKIVGALMRLNIKPEDLKDVDK